MPLAAKQRRVLPLSVTGAGVAWPGGGHIGEASLALCEAVQPWRGEKRRAALLARSSVWRMAVAKSVFALQQHTAMTAALVAARNILAAGGATSASAGGAGIVAMYSERQHGCLSSMAWLHVAAVYQSTLACLGRQRISGLTRQHDVGSGLCW